MHAKTVYPGDAGGVPICLATLRVSFTLGITAKNAGLSAFQATPPVFNASWGSNVKHCLV